MALQRYTLPEEHCATCGMWLETGDTTQHCYACLAADVARLRAALVESTARAIYGDRVPDEDDYATAREELRAEGLLPSE